MLAVMLMGVGTLLAQDASAGKDAVKDDAKLFKAETIKLANEAIRDLDKKGVRLAVETYPAVPKDVAEQFEAMDVWMRFLKENDVKVPKEILDKLKGANAKARDEYFARWGNRRAKEIGGNTILILLTNQPKHLEITVTPEVEKKGFTAKDRQTLTRAMLEKLRKSQVDEALIDAVGTLRKHFDAGSDKK
jgi:hypothetical protein